MRDATLGAIAFVLFCVTACGDDTGAAGSGGASSTGGSGGSDATTSSQGSQASGSTGSSSDGGGGPGSGGASGSGGAGAGGAGTGGAGTGGGAVGCAALLPGPFAPTLVTDAFQGSEDFVFDGTGGIVGKDGGDIVRVDARGAKTTIAPLAGQTYGLRYDATGALIAAQPGAGQLRRVQGADTVVFLSGLEGPNGVHGGLEGTLWVTEFGGNRVLRVDPDGESTAIVDGSPASQPNGVVYDEARARLFFTNYSQGSVHSVGPEGELPAEVGEVDGAALDGLVLDVCGNLYAVDNANDRVYRFHLDAAGALVGEPELIAQLPEGVANAQFGAGEGWSTTSLYVAGNPGAVFELAVGVAGAAVLAE